MSLTLPDHKKGDTCLGTTFIMTQTISGETTPLDLTDVNIRMDLRTTQTGPIVMRFTNYEIPVDPSYPNGTLSVVSAEGGTWRIDRQIVDIRPGTYMYDVEFTWPGSPPEILTLIEGTWSIKQDTTHD